ncbi:MAG: phenylalanine--tRNA ligase subunit beta, partial [Bdellovibrionaceae bacterium]|nr:phenylalanine--tRNA ligase subunit beta [Pseudobdellovibrionaceae bacterium]
MKISLKWLQDYVDVADFFARPQELSRLLTDAGLEVEGIENLAKTFDRVVIGHILEKGQHPNADRLSLCQVATGTGVVHQIVCGAQNHKKDDRVVVALPGAVLPGNFEIKLAKVRGVESGGMLCSEKELGLKAESEGILILKADAPIGKSFAEYMGFDDIVLDLKVTPNRADCLSHFGLAREIGAILGRPVEMKVESLSESGGSTRALTQLEVRATELCPRYTGRGVRGVKVGPTPEWMKKRLESVGLNSINNVVDVTNYVMLELGQPLHAFDVREIKGGKITVDQAKIGETFTTLDGTEIRLTGEELTIRDGERVVALAGVVGGLNSGIREETSDVFIEAAYFQPTAVRRTSRQFGIETDSSYRFSRGTNPEAVPLALNRAAQLIQAVAGGEICGEPYDVYPHPIQRPKIEIRLSTLTDRLGYEVDATKFVDWMKRLGCQIDSAFGTDGAWVVVPPLSRSDLNIDMDLVEEFGRLDGYHHIPETLPVMGGRPSEHQSQYVAELKLRRLLQGQGYCQAINYAFIGSKFQDRVLGAYEKIAGYGLRAIHAPVTLINPLTEELNVMRSALAPGLLKNVQHNSRHGNAHGRLFEIGFVFDSKRSGGAAEGNSYLQEWRLALAWWGDADDLWSKSARAPQVLQVKTTVENLLKSLGISRYTWSQSMDERVVPDFLHPGQCASLTAEGKPVGFIGTLHPSLQDELKIRETVVLAEFNLERLMQDQPRAPKSKPISTFPAVDRDIALMMPKTVAAGEIVALMRKTAGDVLQDVRVFDVFEGASLDPGQRSVAFRLVFQDLKGTLEDAHVNELRD